MSIVYGTILEKYYEGKLDDNQLMLLLEAKGNIYNQEYRSFKVKPDNKMSRSDHKKSVQIGTEYDKLSNEARERVAYKCYMKGRSGKELLPIEYTIASDYIAVLKKQDKIRKAGAIATGAGAVASGVLAAKNASSLRDSNSNAGATKAALGGVAALGSAKVSHDLIKQDRLEKKRIKEGIKSRMK